MFPSGFPVVQQEEGQSDEGEDIVEESGTEATTEYDSESIFESSAASSTHAPPPQTIIVEAANADYGQAQGNSSSRSRAAQLAATRGLSVATDKASRRHSRMMGLPASPRPPQQPIPAPPQGQALHATSPSPHPSEHTSPSPSSMVNSPQRPT